MGCVASRLEEEEEVVSICRERKRQLKLAVERRYALADAHYRYCKSLYGVSAAISLFGARHSSPHYDIPPSSPPKETVLSNPLFLQQAPTEPTKESIAAFETCSSSDEEEIKNEREEEKEQLCGYFYMDMPQAMASPQRDFGWDFFNFNPFNNVTRPEIMSVYNRMSEEELRAVREQEGIPDLEDENEEGEKMEEERKGVVVKETENAEHVIEAVKAGGDANVRQGEQQHKGLTVIDTPVRGRELLEALKDIADHFIKAYDSGKDVSRMLECNRVHFQSNLEELKGKI